MTATACRRCDFRATDDEPLAVHAIGSGHGLCPCCTRSLSEHDGAFGCETCLTEARALLSGIVTLYAELEFHLGRATARNQPQIGRSSDGMPLVGGDRLVLLSGGSTGLSEDATTSKDTDPPSISFELGWWAIALQTERGDDKPLGHTPSRIVANAAGYLEVHARWAAGNYAGFPELHTDLKRLHATLERATGHDLPRERTNADCFECGGDLIRVVDPKTGLTTDDVQCCQCRASYDPARYRLALRAAWEKDVEVWVPLTEAARLIRRNVETVETWAKRGQVDSACRCSDGRKLVSWRDVQARDREAKERAAAAAEAKRLKEAS